MPKLVFRVNADTSPVKKFRTEIEQIEKAMIRIKGENFSFDHWVKEFERLKTELEKKRAQIDSIKKDILTVNPIWEKNKFDSLNTQLSKSSKERDALINDTISLSNKFGKAYDDLVATLGKAQKVTDEVTARFIEQKQIVANLQSEVRSLNAEYRNADKGDKVGIRTQIISKQKELEQQRVTLNALKAEQERAKLAVKGLSDETRNYEKVVGKVSGAQAEANLVMGRFGQTLLKIGGLATLQKFASDVIRVRGEFQKTQVAFETMLGSKAKADALMSQMIETAAKTPFDLQGVANGAKQLLAYGTEAKDVNDTLIRLGNIASGLSIPLGDMVYLYGTTQTQGRLFAQDVRQFMGRGIPLVKELASMLGKTEEEINKMVTAGQIGFPEVEKVIKKMTDEGGQFYNLMEKQSETLSGQISNLGDAWDRMLNSIGEDTQGLSSKTISMATMAVEHYEEIGQILKTLIVLYGTYKAALIFNIALEKAQAVQRLASIKGISMMKMLTDMLTGSVTKLNVALAGRGFALIGGAAVASSLLLLDWANKQDECTKAVEKFNKEQKAAMETEKKRKQAVENAISVASDEKKSTNERADAISVLKQMYKDIIPEYDKETFLLKNILAYKNKINEADERNARIGYKTKLVMLDRDIAKYEAGLKEANKQGAGQATQGIMNTLNNLKKERELYSNLLNDIEKEQITTKTDPKSEIKNKSYWEKQKDNAQTALESIASSQKKLMDAGKFDGIDAKMVESYKKNTKLLKEAERELKVYDFSSKQENHADKLRQEQEKYKLFLDKQKLDRIRAEEDLQMQVAQSKIDAMSDGFLKEQEQRDLNNKKEIQSIKRQKEDAIRTIIQAKKDEFDAQENLKTQQKKGYVKKIFDASTVDTSNVSSSWDVIIDNTSKKQQNDKIRQQEVAWNEYIIKYGTFTQKKEAIDRKYKQLIDDSSDAGTAATFQKEWEEALTNLDLSKLKQEINWEMIFGDLSKVTKDQLRNIKKQLQEFKNSLEFQKATPEQIEVIESAFNSINNALVDKGGFFGGMVDSVTELKLATEELKKAEEELAEANKKGTEAQKEEAQKKVNAAKKKKQNAEVNVTKSSDKTIQHLTAVGDAIAQLGSSAEMSLSSFGNAAANIVDAFTEAGSKVSGIVGAIFSILDGIQQQGFDKFVGNILESVAGAALSAATFGLVSKNESDQNLERDIEYLTQSNQDLRNSLDNLSEKMDKASVIESNEIYSAQKENIKKQEDNTREAMQRSGAAYSNGFLGIGGSHSSNDKINKGMSASEWERVSKIVGKSVLNASQFFQLSSKEMAKLAEEDTTLYSKIKDLANDGYKDAAQYMDEYITYYKQIEELENAHNQKLTNISFDSVRDEFKNTLLDMESDAEDFAANFEKMMRNTVVEDLMTKKYDPMIQEWYNDYAKAIKDGKIDKDEREYLRKRWKEISDEGLAERDNLFDSMGLNSSSSTSQSSTSGGFQSMSQDSADELNGRFSGLQMAGEEIAVQNSLQTESLNLLTAKADAILSVNTETRNIADDTRDLIANSYLELVQISENTGNSAKYLKDIKADIAEVKKNTSKL
nr:MAG TPA: tail tape measure protein [Caudoviricetes sp.]